MKKTFSAVAIILISGCGSKNEVQPIPATPIAKENIAPELVRVTQLDESIKVGNFVVYEVPKVITISERKKCSYFIKTRIDIGQVDQQGDSIELILTKTERANERNHRLCPSTFGINETNLKTYTLSKLIASYRERVENSLSAQLFCKSFQGCKKANLVRSKKGAYRGIPAIFNVMDIELRSGKKLRRNSWVAVDNLFLNNFSYTFKESGRSEIIDFKRALDFSMGNTK
ncbi:hypothetical protein [Halobacteriovorax sp. JY17]|uniref:hypothetical protein n=1 Tax=Halobacteriovorax sp. JY17 TaxID=2014617 RepID=UPI000C4897D3|nr:hypothetical protein [Halobacteriovorax sp. JY17]PIK15234.1 MAG: hypothetical protein CES88_00555 [Halobacteriovorax sp. JY17]